MELCVVENQLSVVMPPMEKLCNDLRVWVHAISKMQDNASRWRRRRDEELLWDSMDMVKHDTQIILTRLSDTIDLYRIGQMPSCAEIEEMFEFGDMMNLCEDYFRFLTRDKELSYVTMGDVEGRYVGDEQRIRQMLFFVLENAVNASRVGGCVRIEVLKKQISSRKHQFKICIMDNGTGMSEDEKRDLFAPFVRKFNKVTGEYESSGVGLKVVKHIVESMEGGSIRVRSELYAGTEITLEFILTYEDLQDGLQAELWA